MTGPWRVCIGVLCGVFSWVKTHGVMHIWVRFCVACSIGNRCTLSFYVGRFWDVCFVLFWCWVSYSPSCICKIYILYEMQSLEIVSAITGSHSGVWCRYEPFGDKGTMVNLTIVRRNGDKNIIIVTTASIAMMTLFMMTMISLLNNLLMSVRNKENTEDTHLWGESNNDRCIIIRNVSFSQINNILNTTVNST